MSTLHLVSVPKEAFCGSVSDDLSIADFLDVDSNLELQKLAQLAQSGSFVTAIGRQLQIYAVVDGQQRLTTLYLMAHAYARQKNPALQDALAVNLPNGPLPHLILYPNQDHNFLTKLVANWPTLPKKWTTQAQHRLLDAAKRIDDWAQKNPDALYFFSSPDFKAGAILLDAHFGLTSFLTLNDRGKPLTVIEKFKSLLLQYAFDARHRVLIKNLHKTFAKLYSALDTCISSGLFDSGKDGDEKLMQLVSVYLRADHDRASLWQSGETAYAQYFREKLLPPTPLQNIPTLIGGWLTGIGELSDQLVHLNGYLQLQPTATLPKNPSLHFPKHFHLADDYRAVLLSLGLQPHLLALLLKFRAIYNNNINIEWHDRLSIRYHFLADLLRPLQSVVTEEHNRVTSDMSKKLSDYLNELQGQINDANKGPDEFDGKISMLEVVERIQLFSWNLDARPYQSFVNRWLQTTSNHFTAEEFVKSWVAWENGRNFITNIANGRSKDANIRYLLKEYEKYLQEYAPIFRGDLHFPQNNEIPTDGLELEHVFAQNIDEQNSFPGFQAFGFNDRAEFDHLMLWRSGNMVFLSRRANESLGNATPDDKAPHYVSCTGHPLNSGENVCSKILIVERLGRQLCSLGACLPAYRLLLAARCAELGLFALQRFFPS